MRSWRAAILAAAVVVALVACGGDPKPRLPTIPEDVVPGLASQTETLDAETVAADALDPAELTALLEDAGFLAGTQRTFSGGTRIRRVVARVLVFGSIDGAGTYLEWLRSHASDLIGAVATEEAVVLGGSSVPVFVYLPGGCCPKSTPIYLTAWRDGTTVLSMLASGPGADAAVLEDLATRFDRAV